MTEDHARVLIALTVIGAFVSFMLVVLLGFVDVQSPEVAKLVGAMFGYLSGLVTPIVMRYFRNGG